jgi:hypothetical protein
MAQGVELAAGAVDAGTVVVAPATVVVEALLKLIGVLPDGPEFLLGRRTQIRDAVIRTTTSTDTTAMTTSRRSRPGFQVLRPLGLIVSSLSR